MQESGEPPQEPIPDRATARYRQNWGCQQELGVVAESERFGYPLSWACVRFFSRDGLGADHVGDDIRERRGRMRRQQGRIGLETSTACLSEAGGLSMPGCADVGWRDTAIRDYLQLS